MDVCSIDPRRPGVHEFPNWICVSKGPDSPILVANTGPAEPEIFYSLKDSCLTLSCTPELLAEQSLRPRTAALVNYLRFGWIAPPETLWTGIGVLSAGWKLSWNGARWQMDSSFRPQRFERKNTEDPRALLNVLEETILSENSAKPAVALSTGIDSLSIAILLRRAGCMLALTFSSDQPQDESLLVERIARTLDFDLEIVRKPRTDLIDTLTQLASVLAQPVGDPVLLPHLWIARHAADRGVSTLLTGDGAEGLLGEFYFKPSHLVKESCKLPSKASFYWFGYELQMSDGEVKESFTPDAQENVDCCIAESNRVERLHQALCKSDILLGGGSFDFHWWMPGNIWRRNRAVALLSGLSTRCPFAELGQRTLPFALRRPSISDEPKRLLREALREQLGQYAFEPKRSFSVPVFLWLEENRKRVDDLLKALPELTQGQLKSTSLESLGKRISPRATFALVSLACFLRTRVTTNSRF